MELDWTRDKKKAEHYLLHSSPLDSRGEAEERAIQEHLVSNCGKGAQDLPSHMGDRSEAGPEQTRVGIPLLLPCMPDGIMGMNEC